MIMAESVVAASATWTASSLCLHPSRPAIDTPEQHSLASCAVSRRHRGLPLARSEAHLGIVDGASRLPAGGAAEARRMATDGDGVALCAFRRRTPGRLRRAGGPRCSAAAPREVKSAAQLGHSSETWHSGKSAQVLEKYGGQGRNRTADTRIFSHTLAINGCRKRFIFNRFCFLQSARISAFLPIFAESTAQLGHSESPLPLYEGRARSIVHRFIYTPALMLEWIVIHVLRVLLEMFGCGYETARNGARRSAADWVNAWA